MPDKLQSYMQMADEAQRQITGSFQGWTSFLSTVARLYKYPYAEMISGKPVRYLEPIDKIPSKGKKWT